MSVKKKKFLHISSGFCVVVIAWLLTTVFLSLQGIHSLRLHHWRNARVEAQIAAGLLTPLELTLGKIIPDVQLWAASLDLIVTMTTLQDAGIKYLPATLASDPTAKPLAEEIRRYLPTLKQQSFKWLESYQKSIFLRRLVDKKLSSSQLLTNLLQHPDTLKEQLTQVITVAEYLLQGEHKYLIVLQNSDEVRATGGFMGSYVKAHLDDGLLTKLDVQDIYEPDGQNTTFTEAPPGVKEYLSAGKGYRLPDANWNPDFPSAANELLQFFALGKESSTEGIVAINLSVAEQLLQFTGPIYLPDYNQTVTAENLSSLARADRNQFFAGSQQKRSFLLSLFTQMKLQLTSIEPSKIPELIEIFTQAAHRKDIQAFSLHPEIQDFFESLQLTGKITSQGNARYLFLVESNVGINKANRLISREVDIAASEKTTTITTSFINKNPITSLKTERGEYINYQRIFVPFTHHVSKIALNDEAITSFDDQVITTSSGEMLRQVGFLVTIPAESSAQLVVELNHPSLPLDVLALQKQAGLTPTLYHIQTLHFTKELLLDEDQVISFATMQKE